MYIGDRHVDDILREINDKADAKAASEAAEPEKSERKRYVAPPDRNENGQFTGKDWSKASPAEFREKLAEYGVHDR